MKRFLSLTVGLGCLCAAVQAEVPSLINYQGRLTDKAGTPVNGAVDVVLRVYDAKTEGKKVYEETISQVSVVNGVYSFGYGGAGKSTKRSAEVVVVADGETKVYNYSTEHKPLLGDVQLSDGTYTWGSSSGPSDAVQFIGSINAELGNVTAIYIQNAPTIGTIINAVYHYHEEGIVGALSQNKECWQELTINGKMLSPRERLVSVPFAVVAGTSSRNSSPLTYSPHLFSYGGSLRFGVYLGGVIHGAADGGAADYICIIPEYAKGPLTVEALYQSDVIKGGRPVTKCEIKLIRYDVIGDESEEVETICDLERTDKGLRKFPIYKQLKVDFNHAKYRYYITIRLVTSQAKLRYIKITHNR